jgi:hypothetical protein
MRVLSHLQAMNCAYLSFATPQILHKIWVRSFLNRFVRSSNSSVVMIWSRTRSV